LLQRFEVKGPLPKDSASTLLSCTASISWIDLEALIFLLTNNIIFTWERADDD
jgi:hypothetical protein